MVNYVRAEEIYATTCWLKHTFCVVIFASVVQVSAYSSYSWQNARIIHFFFFFSTSVRFIVRYGHRVHAQPKLKTTIDRIRREGARESAERSALERRI